MAVPKEAEEWDLSVPRKQLKKAKSLSWMVSEPRQMVYDPKQKCRKWFKLLLGSFMLSFEAGQL